MPRRRRYSGGRVQALPRYTEGIVRLDAHSKTVLNWLLGLSGVVIFFVIAGSYSYTYVNAQANDGEKTRWREEHVRTLNDKLATITENQRDVKRDTSDLQRSLIETTGILKELNARDRVRDELYQSRKRDGR